MRSRASNLRDWTLHSDSHLRETSATKYVDLTRRKQNGHTYIYRFRKEHQPPLLTLDDAYSLPTEAGLLDLYREQSCLETIQRFQYYPENDDDDEQGLSVEVESASGLDILGHLSSSESLGFTPTSRRNCWLLWDNLMSSTREEIVRKLSIKIRDTIGDLNDHGLNPYYTAYDREEGYETPICRVAAGHYVQHKWAAVFKPTVEQITSVARHSLLRKEKRGIRQVKAHLNPAPRLLQQDSGTSDREAMSSTPIWACPSKESSWMSPRTLRILTALPLPHSKPAMRYPPSFSQRPS